MYLKETNATKKPKKEKQNGSHPFSFQYYMVKVIFVPYIAPLL